jgi:5,10-methylenetetrahydromethanopterin reductase
MTALPRFGLNRFDARSVDAFAADVRRAEALGWDAAFQPDSQLRRRDTYVLMAAAARVTERIVLATLLSNPVNRHPTVTASSIATVDELAPGRTLLGWGVGDTAVRLAGLTPARVGELEASTRLMRALLDGQAVEVGAREPARLPHHRPVPIWIAAGGPRTLRMAGGVADGVFIRVGTHRANLTKSIEEIRAGAIAAGRDPATVRLGAVFHTVLVEDPKRALAMGKSIAAGYYEYSPMLFDPPRLTWLGPDPEKLKRERNVFPDFHHASDLEASGSVVDFLPEAAADAFCLRGGTPEIVAQLLGVLRSAPASFDYVCLHPIPNPAAPDDPERGFMARVAREVLPSVRAALGAARP